MADKGVWLVAGASGPQIKMQKCAFKVPQQAWSEASRHLVGDLGGYERATMGCRERGDEPFFVPSGI